LFAKEKGFIERVIYIVAGLSMLFAGDGDGEDVVVWEA
jgi:hypothetical protein